MRKSMRTFSFAVFALTLISSLVGCFKVELESNSIIDSSTDEKILLHVTENDIITGEKFWTTVHYPPRCGDLIPLYPDGYDSERSNYDPQFEYDRSSGVEAGIYYFIYQVKAKDFSGDLNITKFASAFLTLTETIPSPNGSAPCSSITISRIVDAWNSGRLLVRWDSEGSADKYRMRLVDGDIGSGHPTLLTREYPDPGSHQRQDVILPATGNSELLWIVLETILNGDVLFTHTFKGVKGFKSTTNAIQYASIDDFVTLVKGATERATVDVLANDIDGGDGDVTLTIVDDGGLDASVTDSKLVEVGAENVSAGQYKVEIETTTTGQDPKTQYLYVTVLDPEDFSVTANPDSYTGSAFQSTRMPVLNNDTSGGGGALSIDRFDQPHQGDGVITQVDNELRIIGSVGNNNFLYWVKDEYGNVAQGDGSANLVNNAPVAVNDVATAPVFTEIVINVLGNDRDANINHGLAQSDSIDVKNFTQPTPASGEIQLINGAFHFIGAAPGVHTFTYDIVDSYGAASNTATVTVTVQ